jgi:hypothetical protein
MICRHCSKEIHESYDCSPEVYTDEKGKMVVVPEYSTNDFSSCRKGYGHSPISNEELIKRTENEQKRAYEAFLFLIRGYWNTRTKIELNNYNDMYDENGFGIVGCAWDCLCQECIRHKLSSKLKDIKIECSICKKDCEGINIVGWNNEGKNSAIMFNHGFEWVDVKDYFTGQTRKTKHLIRCYGQDAEVKTILHKIFEEK